MKNAIFGLKKRQDFWTEIILFFTFQVIVHLEGGHLMEVTKVKFQCQHYTMVRLTVHPLTMQEPQQIIVKESKQSRSCCTTWPPCWLVWLWVTMSDCQMFPLSILNYILNGKTQLHTPGPLIVRSLLVRISIQCGFRK